uniref:Aminomethyltransferase n=1 Tax=Candidatus Kentrum sp. MB TaxID=2138164 RepID=A0A450XJB4_9GAMM|nr:MAG: aminomethyltransferase [Candidatus Kentron sp. MB]VFK29258.1 MAG: aminomethyltransferase [Candidatus Kentron sp. MB]VFK74719.1 MAG: aminomethyltransferase [Candidatus Kentron sp. MB]
MNKRTPLYDAHHLLKAKMVDFAGWDMPIHYGSQIQEHHQVRGDAGMFDISHMAIVDLNGERTTQFLRYLLANDVAKLKQPGKALYSCMLNENGGVIDDLIVYNLGDDGFRLVVNAATRDKDLAWIREKAIPFSVTVQERSELAMIAAQGPNARDKVHQALGDKIATARELKRFFATTCDQLFIARTGYTGEDGYEIAMPAHRAPALWQALLEAGIAPIGLGARDTLRLEAGMNLYGQDMTEHTSPFESGLGWTVALEPGERDFIGRDALTQALSQGNQPQYKRVGLILEEKGVLRPHQKIRPIKATDVKTDTKGDTPDTLDEKTEIGEVTSGSFSPTLGQAIALARVPIAIRERCAVEIRGKQIVAKIVRPPFV